MTLSLFSFTVLTGLTLLAFGLPFFMRKERWREAVIAFGRSDQAAYLTMGLGGAWFLYSVSQLSPADELFGSSTRPVLLALFGTAWVGSFFVLKEFLSVRGLAVLILMAAAVGLNSAFGLYEIPTRLLLVTLLYGFILLAIFLGIYPYRWRDFFQWLFTETKRCMVFGATFTFAGVLLLIAAFTY